MSAKKKPSAAKPAPLSTPPSPAPELVSAGAAAEPAWIESTDPKRRTWGKIILVALWLYVAALWLLALDQTFDWGIFGPKVPPTP